MAAVRARALEATRVRGRALCAEVRQRAEAIDGGCSHAATGVRRLPQGGALPRVRPTTGRSRDVPGTPRLALATRVNPAGPSEGSGSHPKAFTVPSRKARVIRRKLYCLNPNSQWWN